MTPVDAAGRLGISVRQIDYWAKAGYIDLPARGSGHPREINDETFLRLRRMTDLTSVGFTTAAAANLARYQEVPTATPMYPGGERSFYLPLSEHVTVTIKERAHD